MVVTCVAFTRSLPASSTIRDLPIEAAATAHLDRRYVAGSRVRTGRLPVVVLEFRARPVAMVARAMHHRRTDLVDLVLEIDDPEAATYLAAFGSTASAVAAELFRLHGERRNIASLHAALASDLLGRDVDTARGTSFRRLVFHRTLEVPPDAAPGIVPGHHVTAGTDRLDVHSDTTVLGDERLGYEMVAGLVARSTVLVDDLTQRIEELAHAAGDSRFDCRALLEEAAETQRRAVVLQREVTPHRLLAPTLAPVHRAVDGAGGIGADGWVDLDRSLASLERLTDSLLARAVEQRVREWERYGFVALVLLTAIAVVLIVQTVA